MLLNLNPLETYTTEYLDELKDAIKKGSWDALDSMRVGKDIDGNDVFFKEDLWAIADNIDEGTINLVFTQHSKKLERNITNQIKCIALVAVYYSQDKRMIKSIAEQVSLLKCLAELMLEIEINDFSLFDTVLYKSLGRLPSKRDIYGRHFLTALNFINKNHHLLPFNLKTNEK